MSESLQHAMSRGNRPDHIVRIVNVPNPAAGADWSVTVPGGEIWSPVSINESFAASAVVANRVPRVRISDGTTIVGEILVVGAAITASQTYRLTAWRDYGQNITLSGSQANVPIPPIWIPSGFTLTQVTNAIDVGDQWSAIALWVEVIQTQPQGVHEERMAGYEANLIAGSLYAER